MDVIKIIIYAADNGKSPFDKWREKLDNGAKTIIRVRLARIAGGDFGDHKMLIGCDGVCELRIAYGPGYRIYYGKRGMTVVVILAGGDKGSQKRDIEKARQYWLASKELFNEDK